MSRRLGISGSIARQFQNSAITPLLGLVGLLMGVFAILITPKEEEPQINVTFANVFIPFPGATATEVAHLVSTPAEQVLSEIEGIEHVYSVSQPGMSMLTVQYTVGEDRTDAIVRLYSKIFSNQDWLPENLGVLDPIVKPKGIDDVPIVAGTLWTTDPERGSHELLQVAHALVAELKRVPGTRDIYVIGGPDRVVHVLLDPQKAAAFGLSISDLRDALQASNTSFDSGGITRGNEEILVTAGTFLTNPQEVGDLVVGVRDDSPVYLRDVATVRLGPDTPESHVSFATGQAADKKGLSPGVMAPAVTIAVAKKPGENAVEVAQAVIDRFQQLQGTLVPDGVRGTVTRNYGASAESKANKLIQKLAFATLSVVLLVWLTMGTKEGIIVGAAVVITLLITLFASWAYGFTLNRVSLFALIFSIGILVDDAIVVVENVHRHLQMGGKSLAEAIPIAVDEVGGPTILATATVIAALLPMAFVSGLMGPYMSPIPINASMGMVISLVVAFVLTPWLCFKLMGSGHGGHDGDDEDHAAATDPKRSNARQYRFFTVAVGSFLGEHGGPKTRRRLLFFGVIGLIAAAMSLGVFKIVVLKMLPFDNKNEFQIVVDMPEGTPLEQTKRVLDALGTELRAHPEVTDIQIYAGTAAPINFNGLVRQYYLREGANVGDIQVNLTDKHYRALSSHEIARALREPLQAIGRPFDANVKIVEVPPGPPVQSPLVAEVYGPDYEGQIEVAKKIREVFAETKDIIDIDDSVEVPSRRVIIAVDRQKAALLGVSQRTVARAINAVVQGEDMGYMHGQNTRYPIPIRVEFSHADKAELDTILSLQVKSRSGELVPVGEVVQVLDRTREFSIQHKDLLPVVYTTGDMGGRLDSPLYGMFEIFGRLQSEPMAYGEPVDQHLISPPDDRFAYTVKWDGEWQITYETFRDMGLAYSVGLVLIYLLVVAQFRSYIVPLVIMAPIPLTLIGIMPGHAIMGAQFTATSMIGLIALAGIIVRNSILLVDFINEQVRAGDRFEDAVIAAGAVRAKPIILTGLAAMAGAFFILDDPIFSGLAVSLISGILVSTILTLVVIPVLYYVVMRNKVHLITAER